ncbi:hypothetical protein LUQ84_000085 [Hamiltosporidium tvaerminnensis]|nr:hypothetical protein LUQ84_000085 [Hamiltosporidium tvaerminnensis]
MSLSHKVISFNFKNSNVVILQIRLEITWGFRPEHSDISKYFKCLPLKIETNDSKAGSIFVNFKNEIRSKLLGLSNSKNVEDTRFGCFLSISISFFVPKSQRQGILIATYVISILLNENPVDSIEYRSQLKIRSCSLLNFLTIYSTMYSDIFTLIGLIVSIYLNPRSKS